MGTRINESRLGRNEPLLYNFELLRIVRMRLYSRELIVRVPRAGRKMG
jgi:hypothetical protein